MESNTKELRVLGLKIKKVEETDENLEQGRIFLKEVEDMKQSLKGIVKNTNSKRNRSKN